MENKKQLVIVPPLSEPLQKLNEVLQGIAVDENIEISLVEDARELNQFMGSAGQSLVVFSNAKKCAMFLQENRFVLAKTHSKVILLTPKEIPTKTLVKFVKIGLTESILESSPPKTLLYKVKLLLRSIKSTSLQQEDKDQVVKSMLDGAQDNGQKDEAVNESEQVSSEPTLNYLKEDKKKKKNDNEESDIDYGENLKGKNNYQEDSIDTNWKSSRKKDSSLTESVEDEESKIEADDSSIDMYYRGKKKSTTGLFNQEEESNLKSKSSTPEEDQGEGFTKTKKSLDTQLEITPAEKKKSTYVETEDGNMSLKKEKRTELEIDEESTEEKVKYLSAEEKEIAKKKDYDELEALFEAAKKRQAMESEDLGGHLKGKVSNLGNDEAEESEIEERKEYDNSDLYKKEKQLDLELIEAEAAAKTKRKLEDEEEEKDPHEGEVDHISTYMSSEKSSTDKIETNMMSEMSEDKSKKLSTLDIFDLDPKNKNDEEVSDDELGLRKKMQLLDEEDELSTEKKSIYEKDEETERKKQTHLDLEAAIVDRTKKANLNDDSGDLDDSKEAGTKLQLLDGDLQHKKASLEETDPHMSFKKLDQELVGDEEKERKSGGGKVDKIDTFYRSGEAKKKEHSWENLAGRRDQIQTAEEKKAAREDGTAEAFGKKDLGETTIDYRAMKAEFDYIAKNGRSEDGSSSGPEGSRNLNQSEDAGTFKVIEIDARGFEFSVDMLNLIYQKDSKPQDFYKKVSEELISYYHAYPVFYTYKVSDKSHAEAFDSFMHFGDSLVPLEHKDQWVNLKTQAEFKPLLEDYISKSMTTWLCRDIPDKSGNGSYWQDVELPSWAEMELKDKKVEMVFPYYDGVDRMGMALVFFPEGVNPASEKSIMVTLEMIRTVQLESIQRAIVTEASRSDNENAVVEPEQKNKITSLFKGLFNRNKAS